MHSTHSKHCCHGCLQESGLGLHQLVAMVLCSKQQQIGSHCSAGSFQASSLQQILLSMPCLASEQALAFQQTLGLAETSKGSDLALPILNLMVHQLCDQPVQLLLLTRGCTRQHLCGSCCVSRPTQQRLLRTRQLQQLALSCLQQHNPFGRQDKLACQG